MQGHRYKAGIQVQEKVVEFPKAGAEVSLVYARLLQERRKQGHVLL